MVVLCFTSLVTTNTLKTDYITQITSTCMYECDDDDNNDDDDDDDDNGDSWVVRLW